MIGTLGGMEILLIGGLVFLIFGGSAMKRWSRDLAVSVKEFRKVKKELSSSLEEESEEVQT